MHRICCLILFTALLSLYYKDCAALTLPAKVGANQYIPLPEPLDVLLDSSRQLGIDEVAQGNARALFRSTDPDAQAPYTDAVIWVRFSLSREKDAPEQWLLEASPSWLDKLTLYTPDGQGHFSALTLGDQSSFQQRPVQMSTLVFPIQVDTMPRTYYIELHTHGPIALEMKLWHEDTLARSSSQKLAFFSAATGAITIMVLMNLVFWLWIRDPVYLLYALFLVSMTTLAFFLAGYGSSLFFPYRPLLADRFFDVALCAFLLTACLFSIRLFEYRRHSLWSARFLSAMAFLFLAAMPFALLGNFDSMVRWVINLGILFSVFQIFFVGWLLLWRRQFQYLLPAIGIGFTNVIWAGYGISLMSRISSARLDYFEILLPATLLSSIVLLNVAIASRSRQAEKDLKLEQKRALESAFAAKRAMEEKVRQREFVSMVSHEFRTPLAIIDAVAHALALSPAGAADRVGESTAKIRKAVNRLSVLVENILLDETADTHPAHRPASRFDIRDLIDSAQSWMPGDEGRLRIELPSTPAVVEGYQINLEIALRNIVQNAFKYSPPDSPVTIRVTTDEFMIHVDCSNMDSLIPESDKERIFEKYFRGTSAARIPGAGLGLHIARTIARQNGGDLLLLASGSITTFRLQLPWRPSRDAPPPP